MKTNADVLAEETAKVEVQSPSNPDTYPEHRMEQLARSSFIVLCQILKCQDEPGA